MDAIHPIAENEILIDEGCYAYYRVVDGIEEKMQVLEPWARYRLPNGDIITRSERDSRSFGNQILVHSREREGQVLEFDVVIRKFAESKAEQVSAHYIRTAAGVSVERTKADGTIEIIEQSLDKQVVISPLMRIYNGAVIYRLLLQGESQVLVPWIRDPSNNDELLKPLISQRQARFLKEETVTLGGESQLAKCYEYFGGEYQPGTLFWVSESDVLLRYVWQQDDSTLWDTRLENYQRAPQACY